MVIYLVVGTCGEYEDRATWSVAAYRDQALASAHVQRATAAVGAWVGLGVEGRREAVTLAGFKPFSYDTVRGLSVYDADTQIYGLIEVQLLDEVPVTEARQEHRWDLAASSRGDGDERRD